MEQMKSCCKTEIQLCFLLPLSRTQVASQCDRFQSAMLLYGPRLLCQGSLLTMCSHGILASVMARASRRDPPDSARTPDLRLELDDKVAERSRGLGEEEEEEEKSQEG